MSRPGTRGEKHSTALWSIGVSCQCGIGLAKGTMQPLYTASTY